MDSFKGELGQSFAARLPNGNIYQGMHAVNVKKQVRALVIASDATGYPLKGTYDQNAPGGKSVEYLDGLGTSVLQLARVIPGGVLVFVSSYSLVELLFTRWSSTGLMLQLKAVKTVVREPQKGGDRAFNKAKRLYETAIQQGSGSIFFGVFRGKASEGLSFSNDYARAVIAIGIPYPSTTDLKIKYKKEYNTFRSAFDKLTISGDAWYGQQAYRAINQAIGRCIRHKDDYGAVLLMDCRFQNAANCAQLSKWIRPCIQTPPGMLAACSQLQEFFEELTSAPPCSAPPSAAPLQQNKRSQPGNVSTQHQEPVENCDQDQDLTQPYAAAAGEDQPPMNDLAHCLNPVIEPKRPRTEPVAETSDAAQTYQSTPISKRGKCEFRKECRVCFEEIDVEWAFVPCGHVICCERCVANCASREGECPLCRQKVVTALRLYHS